MIIAAVIAEFNPFHNGHAHLIETARNATGADTVLVLMSGNYVQRGEPAILDKYIRTRMALLGGADVVLELPIPFATGSAEQFASGAVSILNSLGCVDYLCFGSECGSLRPLQALAQILVSEPTDFREHLHHALSSGISYPAAREQAIRQLEENGSLSILTSSEEQHPLSYASFLREPNNILAIEYLKALIQTNSSIQPFTIPREGAGYHDTSLQKYSSATALRNILAESGVKEETISCFMPFPVSDYLLTNVPAEQLIYTKDFSEMLRYRLLMLHDPTELANFQDITPTLAQRIYRMRYEFTEYSSYIRLVQNRIHTEASIRRALLHLMLSLPAQPATPDHVQILGFRREHSHVLRAIKTHLEKSNSQLELITKPADSEKITVEEINADNLYYDIQCRKAHIPFQHALTHNPIIL